MSNKIATLLKERQPYRVDGVPSELHPLPPFVAKADWTVLGDAIQQAECPNVAAIPGDKWISLRCDGNGFSKLTKRLQKDGVFSSGYSSEFAAIMHACCRELMTTFSARCGYTQSDELTVLLAPAPVVRSEQHPHLYNGRLQKLCSLAAATVTSRFHYELMALCLNEKLDAKSVLLSTQATFDCRVGMYDSELEALSLVFWRAYDCGVNAISDATYKSGIPEGKHMTGKSNGERLVWLAKHNLLPQHPHQRDGTFLVKRNRLEKGINQQTGQPVTYFRRRIENEEGNVLQLYKEGALLPRDDVTQQKFGGQLQRQLHSQK